MRMRSITSRLFAASVAAICVTVQARGATLYGLTTTHLVRFSSDSPGVVELVGAHGLPPASNFGVNYLAYHPGPRKLFGFHYSIPVSGNSQVSLFAIDPVTGAGQFVADMGSTAPDRDYLESIEYVADLGTLVVSRGAQSFSTGFFTLSPEGVTAPLCNNGRDNDYSVYDSRRDIFYATDPNELGQLTIASLATCDTSNLGALGVVLADLAYDVGDDAVYGSDYPTNHLFRINTTNGGAPFTLVDLGAINTSTLRGLAVVPVACPGDFNDDGSVNTPDLTFFLGRFGQPATAGSPAALADFNLDGMVNTTDLVFFLGRFGNVCF